MSRHALLPLLLLAACGANTGHAGPDSSPGGGGTPDGHAAADAPNSSTIDGPVTPAGVDPATDGTFAVTVATVTIPVGQKSAPATTFVPTGAPSPRPLVFVSPGFQMERAQYTSYAHHLATWGFTVVLADYTDKGFFADHQMLADDVGTEITWAIAQSNLGVDATKIATAGHSLGGDISMLVAADDTRVTAVVGWDPVDATSPSVAPEKMASMHAAIAVIGETTDGGTSGMPCAPSNENYTQFYAAAHAPAVQMTVKGADHMDWVDDPSCSFCGFCKAGTAAPALARAATNRLTVAWLRRRLLDDTAMDPWLTAPPEIAAGTATVVTK